MGNHAAVHPEKPGIAGLFSFQFLKE